METNKIIKNILLTFGIVLVVAVLGSICTNLGMGWFETLNKPVEWIPNWVIPVVWTIIYTIVSVILFIWAQSEKSIPTAVIFLFALNGLLNVLWCLTFFAFNQILLGLVIILLNLVFSAYLLVQIDKYRPIFARYLFIYPVWLLIATMLNVAVWILN